MKLIEKARLIDINYLDISNCQFDYTYLTQLTELKFLNISNNNLGPKIDQVMKHVGQLNSLKFLNLTYNNIKQFSNT